MATPAISIIIIEYYCLDVLSENISSIKKSLSKFSFEIIITSNSCYSTDVQKSVKERFPGTTWIFNEKNGGFAYGMNQGLKRAQGEYLVTINPDTLIIEGFEKMIEFMNKHPNLGAIGPQMINNKGEIQDSCRNYLNVQRFFLRQLRKIFLKHSLLEKCMDHSLIQTVDWLTGAFIMVRREVFIATEGFDEKYFLYAEDMDWCVRIRQIGYEIIYYPKMRILFSGSRRARKISAYSGIFIKSHIRFWNKFGYFSAYSIRKKVIYEL